MFNLQEEFYADQLLQVAVHFCSLDYSLVKQLEPANLYISTKCFLGLYVATLLIDGYKVGNQLISSPNLIQGAEPSWSMGFLFNEVSKLNCDDSSSSSACNHI